MSRPAPSSLSAIDQAILQDMEQRITDELRAIESDALRRYCSITGRRHRLQSLHATIGGKNNTYVDSVRTQFASFRDFLGQWLNGLRADLLRRGRVCPGSAAYRIAELLQDPIVRRYTFLFLERNFYRNYVERTRAKPDTSLWRLWFGDKRLFWGLIIAPAFRRGEWANDRSEMRRARYAYWTIGHVMAEGLVDPSASTPYGFRHVADLVAFYRSVLKRVSNSLYEQAIADRYVAFLERSPDPLAEPFLIPELRYAGREAHHVYRLDFTILNAHTMDFVGFELSPYSTHYAMRGITKRTQKEINAELAARWEREMAKRNAYFAKYAITTVTFTDARLADMDNCFEAMAAYLRARSAAPIGVEDELTMIREALR